MREMEEHVKEELRSLQLGADRERLVDEVSAHLEDLRDQYLGSGMDERSALDAAYAAFDWNELRAELRALASEENFMERVNRVWLPALASSIGFVLLLFVFGRVMVTWYWHGMLYFVNWAYVVALLPVGAAVAYWAREKGASPLERGLASVCPALVWLGVLLLIGVFAAFFDGLLSSPSRLAGFALALSAWGVLPALALMLGSLPFLREPAPRIHAA